MTETARPQPPDGRRQRRPFHQQFRENVAAWGWRRGLHWALMSLLARRLGFHVHYVTVGVGRDDLADPTPPVIPSGYTVRLVTLEDLLPYAGSVPDFSREFLEEAFRYDDECGAAFYGDQLVSFSFNRRARTTVTNQLDVLIPSGFRYSYKAWTHPDHTRRNLQKATGFVRRAGPKRTFGERVISYVETHNYPSLLHGYQHPSERQLFMGYVGWFALFGRQIPFSSRQAKKIGFEFVRKSDPGVRQYVR
jgi:hypothetical protein